MSILEAKRTTLAEYEILMQAKSLANVDERFKSAYSAWMNTQAQATKQRGKKAVPYYEKFEKFFNYEREIDKAWGRTSDSDAFSFDLIQRVQTANEEGGNFNGI